MHVNSGHCLNIAGTVIHSGLEIPKHVLAQMSSKRIDVLVDRGVFSKEKPQLDDKKDGPQSRTIKKISVPKKERGSVQGDGNKK